VKVKRLMQYIMILGISIIFLSLATAWDLKAASVPDIQIVGTEWGSSFIYNVDANKFGPAQYFAINLAVGNNIATGFTIINGDGVTALDYNLLKFSYFIDSKKLPVGVDIMLGGGGAVPNVAAGVGLFINLLQKQIEDTLTTALKCKVWYLVTETANSSGSLMMTLSGQIGL